MSLRIQLVGHATFLIELGGQRIVTDPWFADRIGIPFRFFNLRRSDSPGVSGEIPSVDLILCSHRHADHFNLNDLARMNRSAEVFVADKWMKRKLGAMGYRNVNVVRPWDKKDLGSVAVSAVPAIEGAEGLPQVGYVLEGSGKKIYFGGDTAYFEGFEEIGMRYQIDVALVPVDGVKILGRTVTMTPTQAAWAVRQLKAKITIPHHYHVTSSFPGSLLHKATGTPEQFRREVLRVCGETAIQVLKPGEHFQIA
ncbi:MAG: MBL fold metallo-hydrolase [Deltaproteobacteria bacterium]|nr:MBL fold metallo-hydrolase [Deltaproteobacteria bacterium]